MNMHMNMKWMKNKYILSFIARKYLFILGNKLLNNDINININFNIEEK